MTSRPTIATAVAVALAAGAISLSTGAGAATTTYLITDGKTGKNEHSCNWIAAFFDAADCTYANTIALLNPVLEAWSGPTRNGGYYARGSAGDDLTYNPNDANPGTPVFEPDTIKIEPRIVGTVVIDDNGTPANGTDDTIRLDFRMQGETPTGGVARNVSTGETTRAIQRWQSLRQTMTAPYPVNGATPNDAGGFDYVIGSRGVPTPICRALNPGVDDTFDPNDCFPTNNFNRDNVRPGQPSWWAPRPLRSNPNRIGIERSVRLANKPGPTTLPDLANAIPNPGIRMQGVFEDADNPAALNILANDLNYGAPGTNVVSITVPPDNGGTALVNADGSINYTPALNFTGIETFTYQACLGADCDTAQVSVSVLREVPPAYQCVTNNTTTNDCPTSQLIWGSSQEDPGFDNIVGVISTSAAGQITGAKLYWTQEFLITAFGGGSPSDPDNSFQAGGLTFTGVAQSADPTAIDDAFAVAGRFAVTAGPRAISLNTQGRQGSAAAGSITIPNSDLGVQPSVVRLDTTGTPASGACSVDGAVITYTPTNAFVNGGATDTCNYTITDDTGDSESGTITITIADAVPLLGNGLTREVRAGNTVDSDASFTPGNGVAAQHTLAVTTQASGGSCSVALAGTAVRVTYTANTGFTGNDSCVVTLRDADGDPSSGTFPFTVTSGVQLPGGGSAIDPWSLLLLGGLPVLARRRRG